MSRHAWDPGEDYNPRASTAPGACAACARPARRRTATRAARSKGDAQAKGGGAAVLGSAGAAAPILKIALHAYCRRLRRVKRRHLRRRQRQLPTHGASRVKPWVRVAEARGSGREVLVTWSFRATRSVSSLDITPTIFSGVPTLMIWNSAMVVPRPRRLSCPCAPPSPAKV